MATTTTSSTSSAVKMTTKLNLKLKLSRKFLRLNLSSVFRRLFKLIWSRILNCSIRFPDSRYRRLYHPPKINDSYSPSPSPSYSDIESGGGIGNHHDNDCCTTTASNGGGHETDSDLVLLKVGALGDCQIGKTRFLVKYVGDEEEKRSLEMKGISVMDKTVCVQGARIGFRIWDVRGDNTSFHHQMPIACKDAVAILFMFDLTSRTTLNSVIGWYSEARKWNQTAIPILIGTKFDDFVQLPLDIQWTVVTQARAYARAMKAAVFFSSATHNINVNKIFKFIMAKLFNLQWTLHRNLTIGEPIIDF